MINYTIIFLVTTLISLFIVERMMGIFYVNRKTTLPAMLQSFFIVFILFSLEHFFFLQYSALSPYRFVSEVIVALVCYFIITLNYESSAIKRMAVSIVLYLMFVAVSAITTGFLILIVDVPTTYEDDILRFAGLVNMAALPILYLVTALFRRFKNIKKNTIFVPTALVVPLLTLLVLFYPFFMGFILMFDISIPTEIIGVFLGVFMMGSIILIFYLYDTLSAKYQDELQSALHSQEKEYYFTQCQLMQDSVEQVKAIRHDIKIHLSTLRDYTVKNKAATDYLNSLLGDMGGSEIYSETGNIAFDSIINYKLRTAKENSITVDMEITVPTALSIDVVDVVTILGNLLDNAVYAIANTKEKKIKLDIAFNKGSLFINIENTFDGELKYTESKDGKQKTIATRKNDGEYGHGLKNIRKSVDKYNGHIEITHEENIFSVGILLYVDEL